MIPYNHLEVFVNTRLKRKVNTGNPTPNLVQVGLNQAFEFNELACQGKVEGLLTHGQVRADKDDVQTQRELLNMLLTL